MSQQTDVRMMNSSDLTETLSAKIAGTTPGRTAEHCLAHVTSIHLAVFVSQVGEAMDNEQFLIIPNPPILDLERSILRSVYNAWILKKQSEKDARLYARRTDPEYGSEIYPEGL